MMRFIELFAGIGGFRYGLEAVEWGRIPDIQDILDGRDSSGNKTRERSDGKHIPFDCVYASEWDKYAASIYRRHYGEIDTRDIRTVGADTIPDHDLLTAGFPCQAFSIAGKRLGFEDARGTLFYDVARICERKRPGHILLENVKGLLSHDSGKTFASILGILSDLGYRCEWMVLNSKHFGVPQNRERVFIIGHLRGECSGEVFPLGGGDGIPNDANMIEITNNTSQGQRIYSDEGIAKTLAGEAGGQGAKTGLYTEGSRIRRLTPVECERLQGFPDGWTEYGDEGKISDTQRYKCLGNAVTTNVITAIGEALSEHAELNV